MTHAGDSGGRVGAIGAKVEEVTVPDMAAVGTVGRVALLVEAVANWRPHLGRRGDFGRIWGHRPGSQTAGGRRLTQGLWNSARNVR